jgi:hypothetical protein
MVWCGGNLFVNLPAVWILNQEHSKICQVFVIQQAQLRFEHLVEVGMEDAEEVRGREGEYSPVTCCLNSRQPSSKVRPAAYCTINYAIADKYNCRRSYLLDGTL